MNMNMNMNMNKALAIFRKKILQLCLILSMMELVCCSSGAKLSMDSVSIFAEPDANQNSAIAIDLVLVYNQELLKTLGQMSASKYFEGSRQLLLDNPTLLDVWHWELVPGQIVEDFDPPQEKGKAFGGYVFANYLTPGDHRVKIAPNGIVKILLLKDDLKNLVTYDVRDVRNGTTMTDAVKQMEACGECSGKIEVKKGPTGNVKQSSKETATKICPKMKQKQVLPPCPVGQPIPPCPVGVVGAPIPIVVQPLPASPRGAAQSLKLYPLKVNPTQSISTIHAGESDKSVPPQQRR